MVLAQLLVRSYLLVYGMGAIPQGRLVGREVIIGRVKIGELVLLKLLMDMEYGIMKILMGLGYTILL